MDEWSQNSDEEVVEAVRNRDQEIYEVLVDRYQDKLMRYVTYLINDERQAADAVQQAFIKAFVNLQGFDTGKKFSSWIYRIAHNEAINLVKKYHKELSLEEQAWVLETTDGGEDPGEQVEEKELKKMMTRCLDELPVRYRSVLVLYYLQGRSYEEISDVLRLPVGTVGTRIRRGKKALAVICEKKGGKDYVKT